MISSPLPPLREDHRQITVDETVAAQWLQYAFGVEEANVAMSLPQGLREELYSDVLHYGPAAEQIRFFFNALSTPTVMESGLLDSDNPSFSSSEWEELNRRLLIWVRRTKLYSVQNCFSHLRHAHLPDTGVPWHVFKAVCWMLNGQHLFDDELTYVGLDYVDSVDRILKKVGMEPLAGVFTDRSKGHAWERFWDAVRA